MSYKNFISAKTDEERALKETAGSLPLSPPIFSACPPSSCEGPGAKGAGVAQHHQ